MTRLSCVVVRRRLGAHFDGELPVDLQVAVEAHLSGCVTCAERLVELGTIRDLVRRGAVTDALAHDENALSVPVTLAGVVDQAVAERQEDWPGHVGRVMRDTPRVWIPGGALAFSLTGAAVLAVILSLFTPTNQHSLAAILDPGSNQNPVMVARGVSVPQMSLDDGLAVLLSGSVTMTLPTPNLALAAVVTREGEVSSLEVLSPRVSTTELPGALFRLTSDIRFKPAQYAGIPVAVNVVWLFEQTTVRPLAKAVVEEPAASLTS